MPGFRNLFSHKKKPDPDSETYLLDKAMEKVRKYEKMR